MPRTQHSRKPHSTSSSFTKFVTRLQHTFSAKNIISSTPVIQQHTLPSPNPPPVLRIFPPFMNSHYPRFRLSQLLYDSSRQIEYFSTVEEESNLDLSELSSSSVDGNDSCYDSMSEHRNDQFNLSQMNVSMDNIRHDRSHPLKHLQLPNSLDDARFHSTAINDVGHH